MSSVAGLLRPGRKDTMTTHAHESIPADILADIVAPGCSVPGRGAVAAMMGAQALESFADELQVMLSSLDERIGTTDRDVMHRIAERARAASQIVSILHRRELAGASEPARTGTIPSPAYDAEE